MFFLVTFLLIMPLIRLSYLLLINHNYNKVLENLNNIINTIALIGIYQTVIPGNREQKLFLISYTIFTKINPMLASKKILNEFETKKK